MLQNEGTCNYNADYGQPFQIVPCICTEGWNGDFCENDIDACVQGSCDSQVLCIDIPPSGLARFPDGYICGSCPAGMLGDGTSCYGMSIHTAQILILTFTSILIVFALNTTIT